MADCYNWQQKLYNSNQNIKYLKGYKNGKRKSNFSDRKN